MDEEVQAGLGGLFGAGLSLATGNPVGAAFAIGGAALSIFGASQKVSNAKEIAGVQTKMAQTEMQQDALRRKVMEMTARRQQMEVLRSAQRARSLALAAATSQGAQFGSGLQGGYGQISGQTNTNLFGIKENLKAGEQMFDLNAQLSQSKIALAQLGGQSATSDSLVKMGGTLLQNAGTASNLGKQFGFTFGNSTSNNSVDAASTGAFNAGNVWNG